MVAPIEPAEDDDLDRNADEDRRSERGAKPDKERAGRGEDGGGNIGADHVKRAMRQVDQVHDAENEGQPGRHQKQHDPELDPVQHLLDEVDHRARGPLIRRTHTLPLSRLRPCQFRPDRLIRRNV